MILRILRALPEKWARENAVTLHWHTVHQVIYGAYPKGSIIRASVDLLEAWTKVLVEICVALGSNRERGGG